uniref:Lymphokineactivated killer Tcelloriginated protein kinaselike [Ciona intestinalis] n=1 Tax=Lepeophtheirus salmonis TaxID=72036 RepID=A0A0K2TM57_LEPSM
MSINDDSKNWTPIKKRIKIIRECSSPGVTPSSPRLHIPPSPCLETLGFGTGVKILLHERGLKDGVNLSPWVLKKVTKRHAAGHIGQRLDDEALILKGLNHPNIIGYRGFKKNKDGTSVLALEKGDLSLSDILEERLDCHKGPLPPQPIIKVMKCVISALHYLHNDIKRLHGDIKSANVILVGGKEFQIIKLCDFGVSLKLDEKGDKVLEGQQYVGTEAWNAMEVIEEETVITPKADIFSYGCLIYEMLTLRPPHIDKLVVSESDDEDESIDDSAYIDCLGTRPELPKTLDFDDEYEFILSIFYACTEEIPEMRPSAETILKLINDHAKST